MRPTSTDVNKRLFILKFVIVHSLTTPPKNILNELFSKWSQQEINEFYNEMQSKAKENIKTIKGFGLWDYVSPNEKEFIESYGPNIDSYMHVAAGWRMEAAGMLMWCLNLLTDWPKIDEELNPDLLKEIQIKKIGLFDKPIQLREKRR